MLRHQSCHCPICRVEQALVLNLKETGSGDWFEVLKTKFPILANFASVIDLLEHLHSQVQEHAHAPMDEILSMLVQENLGNAQAVSQEVLLLVFMPTIHKTFCEVCVRFSNLAPEDISQQVLMAFLELARSPGIKRRGDHLPVALARGLRKAVFRWAFKEARESVNLEPTDSLAGQTTEIAVNNSFETSSVLDDFLARCREVGTLSVYDHELLTKLKLEGFQAKEIASLEAGLSPKAVRRRFERIIARLRRTALGLVPTSSGPISVYTKARSPS